jgi:hypothetical protein
MACSRSLNNIAALPTSPLNAATKCLWITSSNLEPRRILPLLGMFVLPFSTSRTTSPMLESRRLGRPSGLGTDTLLELRGLRRLSVAYFIIAHRAFHLPSNYLAAVLIKVANNDLSRLLWFRDELLKF